MGADKLESLLFQLFEREVQISLPLLHMGLDLLLSEYRSACLQTPVIVPARRMSCVGPSCCFHGTLHLCGVLTLGMC